MSLTVIDRFHPRLRDELQGRIDAGQGRVRDEMALLEPEQIRPLAFFSLILLAGSIVFFVALTVAAIFARTHAFQISASFQGIVLWIIANIAAYIIILPLHELIHALAFTFWGGRPYFGAKLPLALFCGAKDQLFRRDHYLVIGLAPVIVITLAAIIFTLLAPAAASYMLLATTGNFSGAAGDMMAVARLRRLPNSILVEDTETGYRAWDITV